MMNYQEMLAVVDRATQVSEDGQHRVDTSYIRSELEHSYGFDSLQVYSILMRMQDQGLIP